MAVNPEWAEGYVVTRELEGGRYLAVAAMTFGKGRLHLCEGWDVLDGW